MKTKKLLFILNPRAGRNKPHGPLFDALAILSGAGYLIRIHETSAPGDAADTAAREGAGYDLVVAAGGDGTLNEVISGLMRLDAPPPLGYLPQGTTNDFASSLQIPRTPASAAKNIVQNRMRELDIGRWNERSFIYVASFGAFTRSSYAASQAAKNALGHFAYILEGMAADTAAREGAGHDLVVAAGGDGTLNEVISGLMRLDAPPPLGYLPQGTTNDFASSLQIPRTPASAAKNIVQNRMRELDIGRWNERSFIYVASFGAFTRSSYAASQAAKNALGHFAYILEGMKDLNTLRPYHIRLTADGEVLDGDYLFGAVCNSTSIGGLMKLDPERVVLDDGKFEMLLVPSPKTAADLQNLVLALLNQQYDSQGLVFRHVSSLRLETEEELPWSLDGEYAPSVPVVDIVNRQRALRMLL